MPLLVVGALTFHDPKLSLHDQMQAEFTTQMEAVHRAMKKIDPRQLACMAKNIFFEAGYETEDGKIAVGLVVLNRVRYGFAKTPCDVIYQSTVIEQEDKEPRKLCQFSWVCEDKDDPSTHNPMYKRAERIAKEVLMGFHNGFIPANVLFFHATSVDPQWKYYPVMTIGNHVFYSKYKQKSNNDEQSSQGTK